MSPDPTDRAHEIDENVSRESAVDPPVVDAKDLGPAGLDAPDNQASAVGAGAGSSADRLREPSFLHPSSVIFEATSHLRRILLPAFIGLAGAAQGSVWALGVAGIFFAGSLVSTLLRYFTLRYRIHESDFVVTEGLLFRRVRSVPIRRIQNVDLVQNILHRLFGVAEVNIETASGTKPEATLRVLTHQQIEELRQAIFGTTSIAAESESPAALIDQSLVSSSQTSPTTQPTGELAMAAAQPATTRTASTAQAQLVYAIPLRQLIYAGLASNRGTVLLGIAVGFFFQPGFDRGAYRNWGQEEIDALNQYLPSSDAPATYILTIVAAVLGFVLLLRLLSIAWHIQRFYGYQLTRLGEDLRISCGLLTRVSATVPRRRVQLISVHRSLLMRWMGLAAIRIETAGGAGTENENAATTVSRRWFLPVIADGDVNSVLAELRPDIAWDTQQLDWHGLSPRTPRRLMMLAGWMSLIVAAIGLGILRPWGWLAGVAVFPGLAWLAVKKGRAKRFAQSPWGVCYQSGLFTRKTSYAFFDRIQNLQLAQSPFDRRWQMASLHIDTAAAGPAEHLIHIDYLDEAFAKHQFRILRAETTEHVPSWA